jgi:uncharacterized protein (DUF433 family)
MWLRLLLRAAQQGYNGSMVIQAETPPLRCEADGSIRIGNSRVLLEIVIHAFQDGATPEGIAQNYSTASLADIYGAISYYLRHPAEVEAYLRKREEQATEIRQKIDARQGDLAEIRERLKRQLKSRV